MEAAARSQDVRGSCGICQPAEVQDARLAKSLGSNASTAQAKQLAEQLALAFPRFSKREITKRHEMT